MAAIGEITSGFPFSSATARNLWGAIAADVASFSGDTSSSPRSSYAKWFSSAAGPLVKGVRANLGGKDERLETFESQVTSLTYFLEKWDEARKDPRVTPDELNSLAQEIVSRVITNVDALDAATRVETERSLGDLRLEYRARSWRLCEAVVLDLEARTSGNEPLVRALWTVEALGRGTTPSEGAVAEFARDPGSLSSWSQRELGNFISNWLVYESLPKSLDNARQAATDLSRTLDELTNAGSLSRKEAIKLATRLAEQAEALLGHLEQAEQDGRARRSPGLSSPLDALRPGIVATLDEAVRRIREADPSFAGGEAGGLPGGGGVGVIPDGGGAPRPSGVGEIGGGESSGSEEGPGEGGIPGLEGGSEGTGSEGEISEGI